MKLRLLTFAMITLLFASCSKDEVTQPVDANLTLVGPPCNFENCPPPNYVFPVDSTFTGQSFFITYDPSLSLEDIECTRYQYFECYDYLKLNLLQPTNTHEESWTKVAEPDDDFDTTVCNDPRVTSNNCDD